MAIGTIELYKEVIDTFGIDNQFFMVSEECGELLSAIGKYKRGRCGKEEVITELADVAVMIEQMAVHFGFSSFFLEKEMKIARLRNRLAKRKESGTIVTHTDL